MPTHRSELSDDQLFGFVRERLGLPRISGGLHPVDPAPHSKPDAPPHRQGL